MSTPLHQALVAKLRQLQPLADHESLAALAGQVAATGAYTHNGANIVPTGDERQVKAATQLCPELVGSIGGEYVGSVERQNPHNPMRVAEARLRSLGIGMEVFNDISADPRNSFNDWTPPPKDAA